MSQLGRDFHFMVFNLIPLSLVVADESGLVVWANATAEDLFGFHRGEMREHPLRELVAQEVVERYPDLLRRLRREGRPGYVDVDAVRRDGSTFPARVALYPFVSEGRPFVLAIFVDVSEERRVRERLREAEESLEAMEARFGTLERHIRSRERLHSLGVMSLGIAHDIRKMLTPVMGYSEMVEHRLRRGETGSEKEMARLVEFVVRMRRALDSALAMLERLERFGTQKGESKERRPVDLNRVVSEVVSLTEPRWRMVGGRGVEVFTHLSAVPPVMATEPELKEALVNLVFNAVEAMPRGGVLSIATRSEGDRVILEVADSGSGMSPEVLRRATEALFTTKGEGSGVGLTMVKEIVERYGGGIRIESTPGRGTRVTLSFPSGAYGSPEAS